MTGNHTNFMNNVQTHIANLCQSAALGAAAGGGTDQTVRTWFRSVSGTPQPLEVNPWMMNKLGGTPPTMYNLSWAEVGGAGRDYYDAIDVAIARLVSQPRDDTWPPEQLAAWDWFTSPTPVQPGGSPQTVAPQDVLDWIEINLPTANMASAGGSGSPTPAERRTPEVHVPGRGTLVGRNS